MVTVNRRVLITGASGLVGRVLRKALAEDYEVAGVAAPSLGWPLAG
jgi:nucleoside-diphosphate-sugar epimerase